MANEITFFLAGYIILRIDTRQRIRTGDCQVDLRHFPLATLRAIGVTFIIFGILLLVTSAFPTEDLSKYKNYFLWFVIFLPAGALIYGTYLDVTRLRRLGISLWATQVPVRKNNLCLFSWDIWLAILFYFIWIFVSY